MRLALTDLWAALADGTVELDRREKRPAAHAATAADQDLAIAEQALTAFTNRISAVLERPAAEHLPFLAEPNLPDATWVSANLGTEVLLLRVSRAIERFARLLESLRPEDFDRKWRSRDGIFTIADLVESAPERTCAHLEAAARPAPLIENCRLS